MRQAYHSWVYWFALAAGSATGQLLSPLLIEDFPWKRGVSQAIIVVPVVLFFGLFFVRKKCSETSL